LSSTISTRLPCSSGCTPTNSRRRLAGSSAVGATIVKKKVEPLPRPALSTHIRPPISSARRLLIARPRPVPPYLRVVLESACENDWNRRPMPSALRPMPVSRTANVSADRPVACAVPDRQHDLAASVNFTALASRFRMIWRSRVRSPLIAAGTSPSNT
jgi:hypothetical protein